jgi:phage recombination protein Bet
MTRSNLPAVIPPSTVEHFGGQDRIDLIRDQIAKGVSHGEFALFLAVAERTGLDPFARQIYAIPRGGKMTIQTGIDGYRAIADRAAGYAGSSRPVFEWDDKGKLEAAVVTVRKVVGGTVAEFDGVAYWDEYAGNSDLWKRMPRTMLAKCAEAQALRKAFPSQLSGVYTHEEMAQADVDDDPWRARRAQLFARWRALPESDRKQTIRDTGFNVKTCDPSELDGFEQSMLELEDDDVADAEIIDADDEFESRHMDPAMEHTLNAARFDKPLDVSAVPVTPEDIARKAAYAIDQRAKAQTRQVATAAAGTDA